METSKWVLGKEHPNSLSSMHTLAMTYHTQGQWNEAEELLMVVIEARKRVLARSIPTHSLP